MLRCSRACWLASGTSWRKPSARRVREESRAALSLATGVEVYRIGLRVLPEAIMKEAADDGSSHMDFAAVVSAVWRLQDVWGHASTAADYKESRESFLSRERQRAA